MEDPDPIHNEHYIFISDPFTIALTLIYFIMAIIVSIQIFRILYYGHSRFSFQFGFLLLCLFWVGLRFEYFLSIMCGDFNSEDANEIIYHLPINVQFATFYLLILYYARVVNYERWQSISYYYFRRYIVFNVLFLVFTIVWTILAFRHEDTDDSSSNSNLTKAHLLAGRQIFSGCVFLILAGVLRYYGRRIDADLQSHHSLKDYFAPNGSLVSLKFMTNTINMLFVIRSLYDFLSIMSPTFQLDVGSENLESRIITTVLIISWEIVPILLVLVFFGFVQSSGERGLLTANVQENEPTGYGSLASPAADGYQNEGWADMYDNHDDAHIQTSEATPAFPSTISYFRNTASIGSSFGGHSPAPTSLTWQEPEAERPSEDPSLY